MMGLSDVFSCFAALSMNCGRVIINIKHHIHTLMTFINSAFKPNKQYMHKYYLGMQILPLKLLTGRIIHHTELKRDHKHKKYLWLGLLPFDVVRRV